MARASLIDASIRGSLYTPQSQSFEHDLDIKLPESDPTPIFCSNSTVTVDQPSIDLATSVSPEDSTISIMCISKPTNVEALGQLISTSQGTAFTIP